MSITNIIESLENVRKAMDALRTDREEAAQYLNFIDGELVKLSAQKAELERQSVGSFKGRSYWTHEQTLEARRNIRAYTGGWLTVGEICDRLPTIDRALVEREIGWMVERGALNWNGKRGPASKYVRV